MRKVPVELGVAVDGLIQVRGELKKDDLVVVTGNERLVPGAEVEIIRRVSNVVPEIVRQPVAPGPHRGVSDQ